MKLIVVHDHPFRVDGEKIYSGGSFPVSLWERYLKYFDSIVVFARRDNRDQNTLSSFPQVSFKLTDRFTPAYKKIYNRNKVRVEFRELFDIKDAVFLFKLPSTLGFIGAQECIKEGKPFIVEQLGDPFEAGINHGNFYLKLLAKRNRKINIYINKRAPYILYVTKNYLQEKYPSAGISVGISDVIIPNVINEEDIDFKERFYNEKLKIGLIGSLNTQYKGHKVLLQAISCLPESIKENIELYFVGKGDSEWIYSIANKFGVASNIKFIGSLQGGEQIFGFLRKMSLYIQPSLTEGMPRSVLEAMSMGCPILGSAVGGIPDVLNKEMLHVAGDFTQLGKQIEMLFLNRNLLEQDSLNSIKISKGFMEEVLNSDRDTFFSEILQDLSKL